MTRIRTRSQFNFDSASRQLDTRDLDNITDPTTDLGGAVADAVAEYADPAGTDLLPAYPGLDLMDGSISGPLSNLGDDWGDLAAVMDRADGYEEYPATLPALGAWTTPSANKIRWTPTAPGIYQWYCFQQVDLDITAHADTRIRFRQALPAIVDETWGSDLGPSEQVDTNTFNGTSQGMLMASAEMIAAGWGGLNIFGPHYTIGGSEVIDANYVFFAVMSWSPAGTVPYLDGI